MVGWLGCGTGNGRHDHNLYGKLLLKVVVAIVAVAVVLVVFIC